MSSAGNVHERKPNVVIMLLPFKEYKDLKVFMESKESWVHRDCRDCKVLRVLKGPKVRQTGPFPDVTIFPEVNRYFYMLTSDIDLTSPAAFPANLFTDDSGNMISVFSGLGPNSFNNLFINGILQEGNVYNASPNTLTLNPQSGTMYSGTPITLETVQFIAQVSYNEAAQLIDSPFLY
jgi:hypothetical protein